MQARTGVETRNWFGDIRAFPAVVVQPANAEELIAIVRDPTRFPSPVRAAGSNHSTTRCVVADGGTVVDMTGMHRILHVGENTVTAQAGALYIDVAKELQKHHLQFYVNIELGNLSMGSASCTHTKDGSFPNEYGLVCSYAVGMKAVLPNGEILVVTEEQPNLLQAMRTSFGLLGIVYETTFRVKPLRAMAVHHENFTIAEFERQLDALRNRGESIMYYLFPHQDRILVELRKYAEHGEPGTRNAWAQRNLGWKTVGPTLGMLIRRYVPTRSARDLLFDRFGDVSVALGTQFQAGDSNPADQIMRYPATAGPNRYTFSIWAFPEEIFPRVLREYCAFCRDYYETHGYRCDLANVGYRINRDTNPLFSYSYHGTVMTVDPVSTGGAGWPEFLDAYNEFCSRNGGSPLLNQTAGLTEHHVVKAYGDRLGIFRNLQRRHDPEGRFVNRYFAELLGLAVAGAPTAPEGVGS